MTGPKAKLTAMAVLLIALLFAASAIPSSVAGLLVPLLVALLANELDRSGRLIGVPVVRVAALLVSRERRYELREEWTDHVLAVGADGLAPVLIALGIALSAAPRIAAQTRLRPWFDRYITALLDTADEVLCLEKLRYLPGRGSTAVAAVGSFIGPGAVIWIPVVALVRMRCRRPLSPLLAIPLGCPLAGAYLIHIVVTSVATGGVFDWVGFGVMFATSLTGLLTNSLAIAIKQHRTHARQRSA